MDTENMTMKELIDLAYQMDSRSTYELMEVYQNSDMPNREFVGHLKIIAKID